MWLATNHNTAAVFGCSFVELPLYVRDDLSALTKRKARLDAKKPKRR